MGDPEVDLEGQGRRSKVKVTRLKKRDFLSQSMHQSQGHMGRSQRSLVSRSKVTSVK